MRVIFDTAACRVPGALPKLSAPIAAGAFNEVGLSTAFTP